MWTPYLLYNENLALGDPHSVYHIITTFVCILASPSFFLHGGQILGPFVYNIMMTLRLASLSYFLNGGHKCDLPVYHIMTTLAVPLFSSFSMEHMNVDPEFI
jgi:hypothetical protein